MVMALKPYPWLCCLNPVEYVATLVMVAGLTGTLFVGVPVEVYDAAWVGGVPSAAARRDAYLPLMLLEIVTIVVGDPPVPVVVVRPSDLIWWVEFCLYYETTVPLCPSGCEYPDFP